MKANTLKYFGSALIAISMVNFTSCGVEIDSSYDDGNNGVGHYNRSTDLYNRTWISFYRDMDGDYCCQEPDFFLNRAGIDYVWVECPNGTVEQYKYDFRWSWKNYARTSICMSYGPGDVSYLDNVYIGGNRLSGYLDRRNNFMEFQGK